MVVNAGISLAKRDIIIQTFIPYSNVEMIFSEEIRRVRIS